MTFNLIVVLGPTASGKTRLGVEIARALNGEVISADSRQVYIGMDIGTGKDLQEYGDTPYHLIDLFQPGHEFNVFDFQRLFYRCFEEISARGVLPVLVGGTGMYLDAVLKGYRLVAVPENPQLRHELEGLSVEDLSHRLQILRPRQHNTTDLQDRARLVRAIEIAEGEASASATLEPAPEIRPLIFGVRWPREVLRQRITSRLKQRLQQGLIEEVESLLLQGISHETLDFYGLEYRFVAQYLRGEIPRNDMFQKLNSAIHQFAKRQDTWFRRMEKQGTPIHWVDGNRDPLKEVLQRIRTESATA